MGGMISLAIIEKFPAEYDGALPLCGWLAPVHSLVKRGLDMIATYDYLFDKNEGEFIAGDEYLDVESIQENISRKPELAALFADRYSLRIDDVADMVAFNQWILQECKSWLGGLPAGNIQTIYEGFGNNTSEINRKIRRYSADTGPRDYYINYYSPTGVISDPVLALHK